MRPSSAARQHPPANRSRRPRAAPLAPPTSPHVAAPRPPPCFPKPPPEHRVHHQPKATTVPAASSRPFLPLLATSHRVSASTAFTAPRRTPAATPFSPSTPKHLPHREDRAVTCSTASSRSSPARQASPGRAAATLSTAVPHRSSTSTPLCRKPTGAQTTSCPGEFRPEFHRQCCFPRRSGRPFLSLIPPQSFPQVSPALGFPFPFTVSRQIAVVVLAHGTPLSCLPPVPCRSLSSPYPPCPSSPLPVLPTLPAAARRR